MMMHNMGDEIDHKHNQDKFDESPEFRKKILDDLNANINKELEETKKNTKIITDLIGGMDPNTNINAQIEAMKNNQNHFNEFLSKKYQGVNEILAKMHVDSGCYAKLTRDAAALRNGQLNSGLVRDFMENYIRLEKNLQEAHTQLLGIKEILNQAKNVMFSKQVMNDKDAMEKQFEILNDQFNKFHNDNNDLYRRFISLEASPLPVTYSKITAALLAADDMVFMPVNNPAAANPAPVNNNPAAANPSPANNNGGNLNRAAAYCTIYQGFIGTFSAIAGAGLLALLNKSSSTTTTSGLEEKPKPEDLKKFQEIDEKVYWDALAKNADTSTENDTDFIITQLMFLQYTAKLSDDNSGIVKWDKDSDPLDIATKLINDYKQQDKYFSDIYREIPSIKYKDKILPRFTAAAIMKLTIGEILLNKIQIKRKPIVTTSNVIPPAMLMATSFNNLMANASVSYSPSIKDFSSAILDIAGTLSWATPAGPFVSAAVGFGEFLLGKYWITEDSSDPWSVLYNSLKNYSETRELQDLSDTVAECCSFIKDSKSKLKMAQKGNDEIDFAIKNNDLVDILLGTLVTDPSTKISKRNKGGIYNDVQDWVKQSGKLYYVVTTLEKDPLFVCDQSNNNYDKDQYDMVKLKYRLLATALNVFIQLCVYQIKIELYINNYSKAARTTTTSFINLKVFWQNHCHDKLNDIYAQITKRRQNSIGDIKRAEIDSDRILFSKVAYDVSEFQKEQHENVKVRPDPSIGHAMYGTDRKYNGSHFYLVMVKDQPMFKSTNTSDFEPKPENLSPPTWFAYSFVDAADNSQTNILVDYRQDICWLLDSKGPKRLETAYKVREEYRNAYIPIHLSIEFKDENKMSNSWYLIVNQWDKNQVPNIPHNVKLLKLSWDKLSKDTDHTYWNNNSAQVSYGFSFANIIGGETDVVYTDWQKINNTQNPSIVLDELLKEVNDRVNAIKIYRKFKINEKETEEELVDCLYRGKNKHFDHSWHDTTDASIYLSEDKNISAGSPSMRP